MRTLEERFWRLVDRDGPVSEVRPDLGACWLWLGSKTKPNGHGKFWLSDTRTYTTAHRVAYELLVSEIPTGLQLDHLCRVRHCVNPAHVEPVTPRINTLRGESFAASNAQKTHCPHGHPYDAKNTRIHGGRRYCRACWTEGIYASRSRRSA